MEHAATTNFINGSSYFIEVTYLIASILFIVMVAMT